MFDAVYRYPRQSNLVLPVQVRSSGIYRVWSGWHDWVRSKHFLEIFWCIRGEVKFRQEDGSVFVLRPGFCCCYFPGDTHRVFTDRPAEFCWATFDGELCGRAIGDFSLSREPWEAGECPQELFSRLRLQLRKPGTDSEICAGILGYELLSRAKYPETEQTSSLTERFFAVVEAKFSDPDLTIDSIAAELNVHRSTLMRTVRAVCGQTPQKYLTEFRMHKALALLQKPELSIKEAAAKAGFASANYFGKVFFHTYGRTPSDMRNNH